MGFVACDEENDTLGNNGRTDTTLGDGTVNEGAGTDQTNNNNTASGGSCTRITQENITNALTITDMNSATLLRLANEAEISAGMLARNQASDAAVRAYAEQMIAEHTAADQRLDALMQGVDPNAEEHPLVRHTREEIAVVSAALMGLTGPAFDLAYMDSQLALHAKVLFLADAALVPQVQSDRVRQELLQLRPSIQDHLRAALPIQEQLRPADQRR
jgi:putative membrane protein